MPLTRFSKAADPGSPVSSDIMALTLSGSPAFSNATSTIWILRFCSFSKMISLVVPGGKLLIITCMIWFIPICWLT